MPQVLSPRFGEEFGTYRQSKERRDERETSIRGRLKKVSGGIRRRRRRIR